jgi:thioredoxin-related protein
MKFFLAVGLGLSIVASAAASNAIHWGRDYETAVKAATKSHKLMMVDMFTDDCVWCRRLDAYVYPSKEVLKESGNFVPLKMNAEYEGRTAAGVYGVEGYPTVLFLNSNGDLVYKIIGYCPPAVFAKKMRLALQAAKSHSG